MLAQFLSLLKIMRYSTNNSLHQKYVQWCMRDIIVEYL